MKVTWTARARTRLAEIHDYNSKDSKPRTLAYHGATIFRQPDRVDR
jgi:hypothetical protein